MGNHIFVSYSHLDQAIVDKLVAHLQQAGVAIWRDHESLHVGTPDWEEAVRRGIKAAFAVIYAASLDGAKSLYVRHELLIARDSNIPLYPIWISGTVWSACVPLGFAHYQFADGRTDLDGAIRSVLGTVAPTAGRTDLDWAMAMRSVLAAVTPTVKSRARVTILVYADFIDEVHVTTFDKHDAWCALFKLEMENVGYRVLLHRATAGFSTWRVVSDLINSNQPDIVVFALNEATGYSMTQMFKNDHYHYSEFRAIAQGHKAIVLVARPWQADVEAANPGLPLVTIRGVSGRADARTLWSEIDRLGLPRPN